MLSEIIIIILSYIFTSVLSFLIIREKRYFIVFFTFITGFFFYSVLGLALFDIENTWKHVINIILFIVVMLFIGFISSNNIRANKGVLDELILNTEKTNNKIIALLAIVYILTFIFPYIYPTLKITDLFRPDKLFDNFSAISSKVKFEKKQDGLYRLITSQLRVMTMPFFYINLYKFRAHKYKFILLYLIPIYLKTADNMYISRNEILLAILFIIVFMYIEKYITVTKLIITISVLLPLLIIGADIFTSYRVGKTTDSTGVLNSLYKLISEESNFPIYYSIENKLSKDIKIYQFFIYLICLPIPYFLKVKIVPFKFPELPVILSEKVLGLTQGSYGFYLLLPAVFGEGIMLFGENFSFLYAIIVGSYIFTITSILISNEYLRYLFVYFVLDILRQMRGGAQSIFSQWTNILFYLYIILFIINLISNQKRRKRS